MGEDRIGWGRIGGGVCVSVCVWTGKGGFGLDRIGYVVQDKEGYIGLGTV